MLVVRGDVGQESLTDRCQAHPAAGAVEQPAADAGLERVDDLTHAGAIDPESLRGASEVKLLGHGDEHADLAQIDRGPRGRGVVPGHDT